MIQELHHKAIYLLVHALVNKLLHSYYVAETARYWEVKFSS